MDNKFTTLKTESLKSLFVKEIEAKIISGELKPGEKLPPERNLASIMGISRSVVNSGILELESKGFVKIIPRRGTIVVDYKKEGTAFVLSSIMNFNQGKLSVKLFNCMLETRLLIETECAKCACKNRTNEDLKFLKKLIDEIKEDNLGSIENLVEFNYSVHHHITIASGNPVYAMIFKSFEPVCKNLIRMYYEVGDFHRLSLENHEKLYHFIFERNEEKAVSEMETILLHGREHLTNILSRNE